MGLGGKKGKKGGKEGGRKERKKGRKEERKEKRFHTPPNFTPLCLYFSASKSERDLEMGWNAASREGRKELKKRSIT